MIDHVHMCFGVPVWAYKPNSEASTKWKLLKSDMWLCTTLLHSEKPMSARRMYRRRISPYYPAKVIPTACHWKRSGALQLTLIAKFQGRCMLLHVPQALSPDVLARCRAILDAADWQDGKITAGAQT